MDQAIVDRVIALAMKWQNEVEWILVYKAAESFEENRQRSTRDFATAKKMRDEGLQGETLELFQHGSERYSELSEEDHRYVIAATQELLDLQNLLREHAPKLLRLMPRFNFFFDPRPLDLETKLQCVCEIESAFRVLVNEFIAKSDADEQTPPEPPETPTGASGTVEQRALAVLVNHPDWKVKQIAAEVGTSREYLSSKNCPKFKAARAAIRASNIAAGTKTKTGEMEATGDDDLDFDAMDARMKSNPKR